MLDNYMEIRRNTAIAHRARLSQALGTIKYVHHPSLMSFVPSANTDELAAIDSIEQDLKTAEEAITSSLDRIEALLRTYDDALQSSSSVCK